MKNFEEYNDILYIERKKYIQTFLISLIAFLVVKFSLKNINDLGEDIIGIIFLIESSYILLIVKFTKSIYTHGFFKVCSLFNIFVIIYCLIGILPEKPELSFTFFKVGGQYTMQSIRYYILAILLAFQVNYINKDKKYSIVLILIGLGLIYANHNSVINGYPLGMMNVINVITTLVLLNNIVGLRAYDLFRDKKINYVTVYNMLILIVVLLYMLTLILKGNEKIYLRYVFEGLEFCAITTGCSVMSEHLLKIPYNVIFRDLYERNMELDKLNKRIFSRNRELEFTQKVMLNKESILRNFFTNVPIPLVIINENSERIVFANSSFCEMINEKNIRDIINRKLFSFLKIENNPFIDDKIKTTNPIFRGIINSDTYVDMEVVHILDDEEERIVIFNDVTSAIKAAKMKETMENKKLDEKLKSDFLSNISHDLKTPINVIYSATQVIKMYIENNNYEMVRKYNNISKQNCISLIRLTNNIIDTSRIYADYLTPNLRVKNIVDVAEDVVTSLVDYAESKEIHLIFDTNEEEIYVNLDDEFMQRIILNLISNAIKFTKPDGTIEVILEDKGEVVDLIVRDDGVGMEKTFIENAFNRYSMGKNNENASTKGTGIGLFVVKTLVEKQNGTIVIDSVINEGTTIKMTFKKEEMDYEEY